MARAPKLEAPMTPLELINDFLTRPVESCSAVFDMHPVPDDWDAAYRKKAPKVAEPAYSGVAALWLRPSGLSRFQIGDRKLLVHLIAAHGSTADDIEVSISLEGEDPFACLWPLPVYGEYLSRAHVIKGSGALKEGLREVRRLLKDFIATGLTREDDG